MIAGSEPQLASNPPATKDRFRCATRDGVPADIPGFLGRFLKPADRLASLSAAGAEFLIEQHQARAKPQQLLAVTIGYVSQPKFSDRAGYFVRAELPNCCKGPKSLILSAGTHFALVGSSLTGTCSPSVEQTTSIPRGRSRRSKRHGRTRGIARA